MAISSLKVGTTQNKDQGLQHIRNAELDVGYLITWSFYFAVVFTMGICFNSAAAI